MNTNLLRETFLEKCVQRYIIFSTAVWATAVLIQSVGSEPKLQIQDGVCKSGQLDFGWLDCWTFGNLGNWILDGWTVCSLEQLLIQMDDLPADSCAISPTAFCLKYSHTYNFSLTDTNHIFYAFNKQSVSCIYYYN